MFEPFSRGGVGIHTGVECEVRVSPAERGQGIVFETPAGPVTARVETIDRASTRATDLRCRDGARVRTVEHLLAALAWCGVTDAKIAVDGVEIPILDGSAGPWIASLLAAGATAGPRFVGLTEPIEVELDSALARLTPLEPDGQPVYRVELRFDGAPIGPPAVEFRPMTDDFAARVAPARTFALERDIEAIRDAGLGRGGCFENALIIGDGGVLNPCGARFPDEPARHKLLDAIGDLSLLGGLPWARLEAVEPGHRVMHELVRAATDKVSGAVR
jgi:UDP-3-O-[3-hydroxymyristoyl] N-acetylglucosamine deacetylase